MTVDNITGELGYHMQLIAQHLAEIIETIHETEARHGGHEKRRASRIDLLARISIWPVIDGLAVRKFTALSRDISFTGIGLFLPPGLHEASELIVELPMKHSFLRVLSKVRHCRPMADSIFGVGTEFIRLVLDDETVFNSGGAQTLHRIQESILS